MPVSEDETVRKDEVSRVPGRDRTETNPEPLSIEQLERVDDAFCRILPRLTAEVDEVDLVDWASEEVGDDHGCLDLLCRMLSVHLSVIRPVVP